MQSTGNVYTKDKKDRRRIDMLLLLSFASILLFNLFTPFMSDDFSYGMEVNQALSIMDLFRQEYHQYLTWNGRSVVHLLLRFTLYLPGILFKICNSAVFVLFLWLIYDHVDRKRRYDPLVFLMVIAGVWYGSVDFGQTILWQTGSVNYLWGTTIILGFLSLTKYRFEADMKGEGKRHGMLWIPGLFLLGILAGWCNENTSGACLLYVLFLLMHARMLKRRPSRPLVAACLGNLVGLILMVAAPGNRVRTSLSEAENFSGLMKYVARFQKITLTIRGQFLPLLAIFIASAVILALLLRKEGSKAVFRRMHRPLIFVFLFFAASYALVLTRPTEPRAFFGAGTFLLIAVIQNILTCLEVEREQDETILVRFISYAGLGVLLLSLAFSYVDNGTNLGRIYRDYNVRLSYLRQIRDSGQQSVTLPLIHEDFLKDNPFTAMDGMDLEEDPSYWTNVMYAAYYGIAEVAALPYPDWEEEIAKGNLPAPQ